jgi:hypothetical protein
MARFVAVSDHAVAQHLERWPGEPSDTEQRRFLIAVQVTDALRDGRYSSREPRWSGNGARRTGLMNGRERDRTIRWCWDADESAVFIVDRQSDRNVVVTAIRP